MFVQKPVNKSLIPSNGGIFYSIGLVTLQTRLIFAE